MRKTLALSLALGAASPLAMAQSTVTIYGILDAGIVHERGGAGGNVTNVSSGVASASRIGFRGSEQLGNGWAANFTLEAGPRIDTGQADVAGALFNRQAFVGLSHTAFGALSLGRQYTPYYLALSQVGDPFAIGTAGAAKNLFPTAGPNTRTSNAIVYMSPELMGGFVAHVSYALGEQQGSSSAGRQFGVSLGYSQAKLNARLAYNHRNNDLTATAAALQTPPGIALDRDIGRNVLLAASYDFGVAKAFLAFGVNEGTNSSPLANPGIPFGGVRPTASTDSRDLLIGAQFPFGPNTLTASLIAKDDRTFLDQDAGQFAIGVFHALSKRTTLYTAYAKIRNRRGAGYTVGNNTDVGSGDAAFNLGMRHSF